MRSRIIVVLTIIFLVGTAAALARADRNGDRTIARDGSCKISCCDRDKDRDRDRDRDRDGQVSCCDRNKDRDRDRDRDRDGWSQS